MGGFRFRNLYLSRRSENGVQMRQWARRVRSTWMRTVEAEQIVLFLAYNVGDESI